MPGLDWVALWKIASIVLTGAFGVLGLLTKYKDDGGRITKWGKISLAGILLSTMFGAAVQIKESSDKEAAAAASRRQTLQIVEQTQRSVVNLDRLLRPLDAPALLVQFKVPCEHKDYVAFCEAVKNSDDSDGNGADIWKAWPSSQRSHLPHKAEVLVSVAVFGKDSKRAGKGAAGADWTFDYRVPPTAEPGSSRNSMDMFLAPDGEPAILLTMNEPTSNYNQGTLQSVLDLEGAAVLFSVSSKPVGPSENRSKGSRGYIATGIKPDVFRLSFRNGQNIDLDIDTLEKEGRAFDYVDKSFAAKLTLQRR